MKTNVNTFLCMFTKNSYLFCFSENLEKGLFLILGTRKANSARVAVGYIPGSGAVRVRGGAVRGTMCKNSKENTHKTYTQKCVNKL